MSVSVCLRVSPRCPIFTVTDTLVLPLAVARSSSVATAIRHVLPVSLFPCSHGVSIPVQQRGCGVRLDDVVAPESSSSCNSDAWREVRNSPLPCS